MSEPKTNAAYALEIGYWLSQHPDCHISDGAHWQLKLYIEKAIDAATAAAVAAEREACAEVVEKLDPGVADMIRRRA